MGFLDSLKNQLTSQVKREINKAGNQAANSVAKAVKQASNHKETFTFQELPKNLEELKALPEASLDNAYKTTALCVLALCQYETDEAATIEMLIDYGQNKDDQACKYGMDSHGIQCYLVQTYEKLYVYL